MREVTTHHLTDLPKGYAGDLRVFAGEDDHFGVPHSYHFRAGEADTEEPALRLVTTLGLQSGDPRTGWNGGTTLAYLAALHDFIQKCQASRFACEENLVAGDLIAEAMRQLQARTRRRAAERTFQTHQAEAPKS